MQKKSRLPKVLLILLILILAIGVGGYIFGNSIYNFVLDPANYTYVVNDENSDIDVKYIKEEFKKSAKKARAKASDNKDLFGYYKQEPENHDWVVFVHGFNGIDETIPLANDMENKGYNTLVVENRGYGFSEDKKMSLGSKGKDDVITWTKYIKDLDPEAKIYLYGLNMGANDVLLSSNQKTEGVEGIIVDSPIINMDSYLNKVLDDSFKISSSITRPILDKFMEFKMGQSADSLNVDNSTKTSHIPIFYILGLEDRVNTAGEFEELAANTKNFWGSAGRDGGFLGGYINESNVYMDKLLNVIDNGKFDLEGQTSKNKISDNDEEEEDNTDIEPIFDQLAGKEFQFEGRWFNGIKFEEDGIFYGLVHARVYEDNEQLGGPDAFQSYCLYKGRLERVPGQDEDVFTVADLKVTSDTGSYVVLGGHDTPPYKVEDLNIIRPAEPTLVDQFGSPDQDYVIKFDDDTFGIEKGINYTLSKNAEGKLQLVGDRGISGRGYIPEFIEFSSDPEKEDKPAEGDTSLSNFEGMTFTFDASGRWQTKFIFGKDGKVYGNYSSIYSPGDVMSGYTDRHVDACYFKGQFEKEADDTITLKHLKVVSDTNTYKVIGQSDSYTKYEDLNIIADGKSDVKVSEFGQEKDGRSLYYFIDFPFGLEEGMTYKIYESGGSYHIDSSRNLDGKKFRAEFKEQ